MPAGQQSSSPPRTGCFSPYAWHLLLGSNHRIAFLTAKRLREHRNVRQRSVYTPLLRGVRIHGHASAQLLRPVVDPPALRIAQEIPLLRRVPLDETGTAVPLERALERVVAD